jgi:hypothetical protein
VQAAGFVHRIIHPAAGLAPAIILNEQQACHRKFVQE